MERKGGCLLVPRYGPTNGSGVAGQAPPPGVSWQMGRIMLKFRPIAPKPAAMAPAPTSAPVAGPAAAGSARGKRKAAPGGSDSRRGRKSKKAATGAPAPSTAPVVVATKTVGEKEEKEKSSSSRSSSSSAMTSVDSSPPSPPPSQPQQQQPATTLPLMPVSPVAAAVVARAQPAASSWVTVEDVTSTWRDGEAPAAACGDEAPAFVSDRWGRVTWANAGFARAVSSDEPNSVALAGALPGWGTCAGFTCRVRIRHGSTGQQRRAGVVAPCDVWRLDADGCYLWRLDLQAALTLGGGLP
ncbi:hypothetical protein QOZ80_5AG0386580 [Eleusine coracana subsp. coracana]|nr:hypothetical protein QOZ80_5AG0386580 [Eleusine coracana subsp. coracana]